MRAREKSMATFRIQWKLSPVGASQDVTWETACGGPAAVCGVTASALTRSAATRRLGARTDASASSSAGGSAPAAGIHDGARESENA